MITKIGEYFINYYDDGQSKPPVFFIHGNSFSHHVFKTQFNSNLSERYRIIAIDLLGHGESDHAKNPEDYKMENFANIVIQLAKKINAEDSLFCGHSLGGHILVKAAPLLTKAKGFFTWGAPPIRNIKEDMTKAFQINDKSASFYKEDWGKSDIDNIMECCFTNVSKNKAFIDSLIKSDPVFRSTHAAELSGDLWNEVEIIKSLKVPFLTAYMENDSILNSDYYKMIKNKHDIDVVNLKSGHFPQVEYSLVFDIVLINFYNILLHGLNVPKAQSEVDLLHFRPL